MQTWASDYVETLPNLSSDPVCPQTYHQRYTPIHLTNFSISPERLILTLGVSGVNKWHKASPYCFPTCHFDTFVSPSVYGLRFPPSTVCCMYSPTWSTIISHLPRSYIGDRGMSLEGQETHRLLWQGSLWIYRQWRSKLCCPPILFLGRLLLLPPSHHLTGLTLFTQ